MTHSMCTSHGTGNLQRGWTVFFSPLLLFLRLLPLSHAHVAHTVLNHVINPAEQDLK